MKSTQTVTKAHEFPDFMTDLTSRSLRHNIQMNNPAENMTIKTEKAMKNEVTGIFTKPKAHRR